MQDTVNYLPCRPETDGTRSGELLKTPPGLYPYLELPDLDPPVKRTVRGTHNAEGRFFAVIGTTAYRISNAGVAIPLGTIPGTGLVAIEHNQISLGNEVTFVTGSAGYVYNTVTDTFARITDPGYPGSIVAKFIDGFMIGIEPQGRYAFNSAAANATAFNTLDRFTSEVRPDRLTAAAVSNNELVLFSINSAEFFYNSGAAQQPFRTKRISMDKGCVGPFAAIEADNTVFWLGPGGYFYQLEGYGARRISTRPIEQSLRGVNLSNAFATVWEDAGHTVIYWTFPNGLTWGWDTAQQAWHRRESYGLTRWRANTLTEWNGAWYVGDFQKPRLWRLDWDYVLEGDQEFESYRTLGVIHDNQSLMLHSRIELVMDTGRPLVTPVDFPVQPEGPEITGQALVWGEGAPDDFNDYTTAGDSPVLVFSIVDGALPDGLTMENDGTITGSPPGAPATGSVTVRVTDGNGLWDEGEFPWEVDP